MASSAVLLLLPIEAELARAGAPGKAGMSAVAAAQGALRPAPPLAEPATRRIYPYSIIPGGASDRNELARVIKSDKVVAAHYASFNVEQAKEEVVAKPRAVHVSYRKGDKVYWTAKKVMLAQGETLLSDGRSAMRTRCANRISDMAQLPVEAAEPSEEELNAAVEQAPDPLEEGGFQYASYALDDNIDIPAGGHPQPFVGADADGGVRSGSEALTDSSRGKFGAVAGTVRVAPTHSAVSPPSSPVVQPPATTPGPAAPGGPGGAIPVPPVDGGPRDGDEGGAPPAVTPPGVPITPAPPVPGAPKPGAGPEGPAPVPGVPPAQPPLPVPTEEAPPPGGKVPTPEGEVPPPAGETPPAGAVPPTVAEVPEPGTLWLFAAAFAVMLLLRRKAGHKAC